MFKIGITGGIGSGKSTVSRLFELLGVPVYYADDAAKKLMNESPEIRQRLLEVFGQEVYSGNELNRELLSAKVFNDPDQLKLLNSIVHPVVINDAEQWMHSQNSPYVLKEAAIFFESGSATGLDYMIGVYAPETLRIERVMQRDSISHNEILARMSRQIDEELKMKLCDFVILNDEQQMLIPQVLDLHRQLLEKVSQA